MKSPIIIGTRGSELALWQARHVQAQLAAQGVTAELHIIKTQGDQIQHLSLDKLEGKGFFTKEIEEALLHETIDLAVHSHKDLETEQPEGLVVGAVSSRAAVEDVLLIHKNSTDTTQPFRLKQSAVVGTSSNRRKAQMLSMRDDIELRDIRGNVPTRLQKLRDGMFDAILMAKAGLDRLELDLSDLEVVVMDPSEFVPAPAQGVLALQCRAGDADLLEVLSKLDQPQTRTLVHIERTVLNRMQGGCHLPLGVFASHEENEFVVHVAHANDWQSPVRRFTFVSDEAASLPDMILSALQTV